jgi:hypothetical protein
VRGPIDLGLGKGAALLDGCVPRVQQTVSVADAAIGRDHSDPRCSANLLNVIWWPESPSDARLDALHLLSFASVSHRAFYG